MGFESPSPIQAQAIPMLLGKSVDFLGLAGTGTGKTAAFSIPLLERLDPNARSVQALILCPTRELAMQVAGQISLLGKYLRVKVATVYGGAPFGDQVRALRGGAQVVVGTPGRVIDHLERQTLMLDQVQTLILDEADEMFSMGFKEEIDKVIAKVSEEANTWLFSATMSPEVRRVVNSSLKEPVTVQVNRTAMLSTGVEQLYYRCQEGEKPEMICKLIEAADEFYGLIFCQTKAMVADLTRFMLDRGYKVDCLHGDMDQNARERTMQAFRDKKLSVLICTDVAARGLDVKDITHVVNYSLPREMESYVHRIGRTARSGKTGIVMNLLTFSHRHLLGRIEAHTKVRMKEGFVPTKREVAARKVARLLPAMLDQPFAERVSTVMTDDFREQLALMTPEDVASRFIVMMMPDIFAGEDSRKTKKAAKDERPSVSRPTADVAPVAAMAATVSAPVVAKPAAPKRAPAAVAAPQVETSPVEAAELIHHALEDVNAVLADGAEDEMESDVTMSAEVSNETSAEVSNETSAEVSASPAALDIFGDEVVEKKSAVDRPPRARRVRPAPMDEEEIASILETPPVFGVVEDSRPSFDTRPTSSSRPGGARPAPRREAGAYPRAQSQFRAGPRESRFEDRGSSRPGGFERREGGFERPSRPGGFERREGGFDRAPRAGGFAPRGDSFGGGGSSYGGGSRPGSSRPGGFERGPRRDSFDRSSARPTAASSSRPMSSRPEGFAPSADAPVRAPRMSGDTRPAAPMNLAKARHLPGPAATAREGETGGLNRRARRAALFGRTLDGAGESAEQSSNQSN